MLSDYFDIDSFISLIKKAGMFSGFDDKMVGGMNGFLNMFFSIGKSIVEAGNYLMKEILSVDIINKSIDSAFNSGNAIWDSIFKTFGTFFVMLVLAYGVKDMFRYGLEKIFMRLLMFSSLFIIGTGFYSSGANILKDINTISGQAQNELVGVMAPNISEPAEQLINDLGLTEPEDTSAQVENMMYYRFVVQPFSLFNFGKTDVDSKKIKEFTAKEGEYTEDKESKIDKRVGDQAKKNSYLTGKKLGQKWAILLNSGVDYIIVAGVILLIAVMNFLVQIFILMLVLLSPIFLIRALLPDNEHVMFNFGKLLLSGFALKIILGLGFGFVFMLLGWIESAFGAASFIGVIASLFIKVILAILVFKNYHWFKSIINTGSVNGVPKIGKPNKLSFSKTNRIPAEESNTTTNSVPDEIKAPVRQQGQVQNDYADNVILHSAMPETEIAEPKRLDNLARKFGYMNERGVAGTMKDSVQDRFQESKLGNTVDKAKEFNPKEKLENRFSEIVGAFQEGQLEAVDKHGLLNSPDIPVDPLRSEEMDTRFTDTKENSSNKEVVEEKKYRRTSQLSNSTEGFEERLAKLRGEPVPYKVNYDNLRSNSKTFESTYHFSTEDDLREDKQIKEELKTSKDVDKTTETL